MTESSKKSEKKEISPLKASYNPKGIVGARGKIEKNNSETKDESEK